MADGDDAPEPTLELTVLSADGLKDTSFFIGKRKCFVVAWVDPRLKKSTKTLTSKNPSWNHNLSFPLPPQTLQNPSSCLTIQVLSSPSRSILHTQVVGSAILAISAIRLDCGVFTLQLWRPSGRAQGLLRVSARITSDLGFIPIQGCVTGVPVGIGWASSDRNQLGEFGYDRLVPTAPPLPADNARKNFLIGLLSGAVAAVLVGSAVI